MPYKQEEETKELRDEIAERLEQVNSENSTQYKQVEKDLSFYSGNQYEEGMLKLRQADSRPTVTLNVAKTYVDRIVSPFRLNPLGIQVSTLDQDLTEKIQDKMRDIEYASNADEAYENAFESETAAGMGWVGVSTEYKEDGSLEQIIKIDKISISTSVGLDAFHGSIDGSDADWGYKLSNMDEKAAVEEHGPEVTNQIPFNVDIYGEWNIPEDSVAHLIYYTMRTEKKKQYHLSNGDIVEEEPTEAKLLEMGVYVEGAREYTKKFVKCCEYIGQKYISSTILDIPFIPLIPFYGDRVYGEKGIKYAGLIRRIKEVCQNINTYASNEQELVALAPKSPYIMADGQDEGYEDEWATANTRNWSSLKYKPVTFGGQLVPAPARADNSPQIQSMISGRMQAMNDLGWVSGMFPEMFGLEPSANQSGKSIMLRQGQAELATSQYLDNCSKSIAHVGRVVLYLMPSIYDTERLETFRNKDGESREETINLSEVLKDPSKFDVTTGAGPAHENRRKEAIANINAIISNTPEIAPLVIDQLVENQDSPESKEMAKRLKLDAKMKYPHIFADDVKDAPPPEAVQAMEELSQTVDELEARNNEYIGVIEQLQGMLTSNREDNAVKIQIAELKEKSSITQVAMKILGDQQKVETQESGKGERDVIKLMSDSEKDLTALANKAIGDMQSAELPGVISGENINPPTPGGDALQPS